MLWTDAAWWPRPMLELTMVLDMLLTIAYF